MIYIVEVPHQLPPACWTAVDRSEFIGCVKNSNPCMDIIFDKICVKELMKYYDYNSIDDAKNDGAYWLADMIDQYNLDTILYSIGEGWTADVIDEYQTCYNWLEDNLFKLIIFETSSEAIVACRGDSCWRFRNGLDAREALKVELIDQGRMSSTVEA